MAQQVVVQQPGVQQSFVVSQQVVVQQEREWSTGIFECHKEIKSCLLGFFCMPCFACCLAARMGESCCVASSVPGGLIAMRAVLRTKHAIRGNICGDCCEMACCTPCSLCQMSREMDAVKYPEKNSCC